MQLLLSSALLVVVVNTLGKFPQVGIYDISHSSSLFVCWPILQETGQKLCQIIIYIERIQEVKSVKEYS